MRGATEPQSWPRLWACQPRRLAQEGEPADLDAALTDPLVSSVPKPKAGRRGHRVVYGRIPTLEQVGRRCREPQGEEGRPDAASWNLKIERSLVDLCRRRSRRFASASPATVIDSGRTFQVKNSPRLHVPHSSATIALRSSTTCTALMAVTPAVTMWSV